MEFNHRAAIVEFETYTKTPGNCQAFIFHEEGIDLRLTVSKALFMVFDYGHYFRQVDLQTA